MSETLRLERILTNPLFDPGFRIEQPARSAMAVHQLLPGYSPSPLVELPALAQELGLDRLWLKDESSRMGLPAFKILGASWAVIRTVEQRAGIETGSWRSIEELADLAIPLRPMTLACATDGNHGRAVARMAKWLGFSANVLVPAEMAAARIQSIESEGAEVRIIDGSYDDAIDASAALAGDRCLVISDTAWPGYEDVPRWVIEGYSTILHEIDDALRAAGEPDNDLIAVPIGVGAFATAVVSHYRSDSLVTRPHIVGVEPSAAACLLASVEAGGPVQIPGPHDSIMSGLNCGVPSPLAWPIVSKGIETFVAIDDERARKAMRHLAAVGVVAGECGAAGLAGLQALREWDSFPTGARRALLISTEGATDPAAYQKIVGPKR